MSHPPDLPPIVSRAFDVCRRAGYVSFCRNETGRLLATLAATRAGTVAEFARVWCEAVTEWTGVRPFIYTYFSFADKGNCEGLDRYPLWIAAPGRPKGDPDVPGPWRDWTIHQYSHTPIDKNVFDGTRAELIRHGKRPAHRPKHAHRHKKHQHHDRHHHDRRQSRRGHHRGRRGD